MPSIQAFLLLSSLFVIVGFVVGLTTKVECHSRNSATHDSDEDAEHRGPQHRNQAGDQNGEACTLDQVQQAVTPRSVRSTPLLPSCTRLSASAAGS